MKVKIFLGKSDVIENAILDAETKYNDFLDQNPDAAILSESHSTLYVEPYHQIVIMIRYQQ